MELSDAYNEPRQPWNRGRIVGQKRPLKPKEVWTIRVRLQLEERKRDLAMFNLAIDSKLRGCDLIRIGLDHVCVGGRVRDRATVVQKKTGRPMQFEMTDQTRIAVQAWIDVLQLKSGKFLFPNLLTGREHPIRQYARLVKSWIERAGLETSCYGTHSLRRTKAALIYKTTGNLRAVQLWTCRSPRLRAPRR